MTDQHAPLDRATFLRTSTLFEEKRKVLAQQAVKALAAEIVRRVSGMKHGSRHGPDAIVPEARIADFCDTLVQPSSTAALQFILDRQAEGAGRQVILYSYLAGAARLLGTRWENDEAGFMDVIHGTGHLYALLRALRTDPPPRSAAQSGRRQALFALVPGETHRFGIQLASETFREAGWDIDLKVDVDHDSLIQHVQQSAPDIVGLSLSTEDGLAALVHLVVALRLARPSAIIGVAPALNMTDTNLHRIADIDIIFRDARTALRDLEWMLEIRK